jgi:hypothetical protein
MYCIQHSPLQAGSLYNRCVTYEPEGTSWGIPSTHLHSEKIPFPSFPEEGEEATKEGSRLASVKEESLSSWIKLEEGKLEVNGITSEARDKAETNLENIFVFFSLEIFWMEEKKDTESDSGRFLAAQGLLSNGRWRGKARCFEGQTVRLPAILILKCQIVNLFESQETHEWQLEVVDSRDRI